jgi:hypothetical protein
VRVGLCELGAWGECWALAVLAWWVADVVREETGTGRDPWGARSSSDKPAVTARGSRAWPSLSGPPRGDTEGGVWELGIALLIDLGCSISLSFRSPSL